MSPVAGVGGMVQSIVETPAGFDVDDNKAAEDVDIVDDEAQNSCFWGLLYVFTYAFVDFSCSLGFVVNWGWFVGTYMRFSSHSLSLLLSLVNTHKSHTITA